MGQTSAEFLAPAQVVKIDGTLTPTNRAVGNFHFFSPFYYSRLLLCVCVCVCVASQQKKKKKKKQAVWLPTLHLPGSDSFLSCQWGFWDMLGHEAVVWVSYRQSAAWLVSYAVTKSFNSSYVKSQQNESMLLSGPVWEREQRQKSTARSSGTTKTSGKALERESLSHRTAAQSNVYDKEHKPQVQRWTPWDEKKFILTEFEI